MALCRCICYSDGKSLVSQLVPLHVLQLRNILQIAVHGLLQPNLIFALQRCSSADYEPPLQRFSCQWHHLCQPITNKADWAMWQGTSNISGLISGNLVITHKGTLSVTSHSSGATVHLTFKEPGMFSSKKSLKHEARTPFVSICLVVLGREL